MRLAKALLRLGGYLSGLVCGYAGQLGTGCAKKLYLACQFLYKMGKKRTFLVPRLCTGMRIFHHLILQKSMKNLLDYQYHIYPYLISFYKLLVCIFYPEHS
jgi:hypothetical protein